ncbi:MAG: hypothetical protein HKO93_01740 [Flavobacteriales bacterium]|nr:hypothetical protein [Flavobacteriales bacterium]
MARNELNAVLFLSQPGPKMIWQFGELGYDISIDFDCRVCPKPILWNYFEQNHRRRLFDVYSAMNGLRRDYPNTFNSSNFEYALGGAFKRINLYNDDMDAVVIGNFDVEPYSAAPNFPYTGTWFDYFSGEEIIEDNLSNEFLLQPGEYRVYTSEPLEQPEISVSVPDFDVDALDVDLYPTITSDNVSVKFDLGSEPRILDVWLYDISGKEVKRFVDRQRTSGPQNLSLDVNDLSVGKYHLLIGADGVPTVLEIIKE